MSLFERLKNKRYDLQEGKKKIIQKTLFSLSKISNPVKTKVKNPIKKKYSKTSTTGRGFEDITGEGIKSSDIPKT